VTRPEDFELMDNNPGLWWQPPEWHFSVGGVVPISFLPNGLKHVVLSTLASHVDANWQHMT